MLALDQITEIMNPVFDTTSLKSYDSGSKEANDDNITIEGLVVQYSNVDCITTKTNEIKLVMSTRHKAASNNVKNILDLLRKCGNDDLDIPCYVICVPTEVPFEQILKVMSSKMVSYETNFPSLSSCNDENHATVIISKVLRDLSNPTKHRQALEQVRGHESILSVKPVDDKMIVSIDKTTAPEFCVSAQSVIHSSIVKMKAKKYYGLVKGIESDFELALFKEVTGITDASRLGNSNSVKLCFRNARSLNHALKD
ncbi:hypothetical protein QYM36_007968, partial [Artemia franciscana]